MPFDPFDEIRKSSGYKPQERELGQPDSTLEEEEKAQIALLKPKHDLDSEEAKTLLRKLLQWYYYEYDKQAENRLEMALDADFYDNIQWDEQDANELRNRGQMPLVYNEIAPMVDWVIGTERRSRVDWSVLPRTEDDVDMADVKEKVMKWLSDTNGTVFNRSRAFADAAKVGVGWVDNGVSDDPTKEAIYDKYEDWRNILWDSASYELDLSDARYLFRWRWVDEDIAMAMFPDRKDAIWRATREGAHQDVEGWEFDTYTTGVERDGAIYNGRNGAIYATGQGAMADAQRRRVKLIECQYRTPMKVKVVDSGVMRGSVIDERDEILLETVARDGGSIIEKVMMRVNVAVFTECDLLSVSPSMFRHNKFSLTPIWCYRRSRDRLPYGIIRRVRDIQQDLNKRASKALFMLNTNQIIADEGATDDWELLRDEADRPDGMIVKKEGKALEIRRDTGAANGQLEMMTLSAQAIQRSAGVSQENLGRQTNAVSGEAIKARQLQGSVVTTEPFDNLRLATQCQGEKILSLSEQFLTEEKVIRLTGNTGKKLEWVKVNQPELQPDGSYRLINDITATQADFVVAEQDYAGTLRQVMFESMQNIAEKYPPEIALRLLTMAYEYSDLPNKDEIAEQIRSITGERDPNKELTPEEQAQMQQEQQAQIEAMEIQREAARLALEEQRAKIREINAKAGKLEAEAIEAGNAGDENAAQQIRSEATKEIERLTADLRKAQTELNNKRNEIQTESDTKKQVAQIEADAKIRVAEITSQSNERLQLLQDRLSELESRGNPNQEQPSA